MPQPTQQSPQDYLQALNPKGYVNNREITNLPGHYLVKGSRDCVIVNKEKVVSRLGYTLVGDGETKAYGHKSSFDWETSSTVTRSLRLNNDGELEVYYDGEWWVLKTYSDNTRMNFAPWWDGTELIDLLLMVYQTDDIDEWSGGIAEVSAVGAATITKSGSTTWAQERFLTSGTRKVLINGVEYTYTGGESTTTLTGVTPDPVTGGVVANDVAFQTIRTYSPATLANLTLDLISVMNNHVFYGDLTNRYVYISKSTDFDDFTFTSGAGNRVPGEGHKMTLDSTPTAFVPDEDLMWISARKDDWYKVSFDLNSTQGAETVRVTKLKTATGQGARSQACIFNIKNATAFLSFEPTIDTLGRLLSINTPTSLPISHEIRDDLLSYDLTDAHGIYNQNQLFVMFPAEGILHIYDFENQHWQPPHFLPIGRLALIDIDGDGTQVLCGHSSVANETYRLYAPNTYNDNGATIRIEMHFGYDNHGARFLQKSADEFAAELYASENTVITDRVVYDYKGATDVREFEIDGSDTDIRFSPNLGGGLGFEKLGSNPLGSLATSVDDLSKIRVVNMTSRKDFFERQRVFISESVDARFAVIAYGENVEISENMPNYIKR